MIGLYREVHTPRGEPGSDAARRSASEAELGPEAGRSEPPMSLLMPLSSQPLSAATSDPAGAALTEMLCAWA